MKNYIKYAAILALGLVACEPEFDESVEDDNIYDQGDADFSNYVAVGNSLTAGYADNALYVSGQKNAYPNILAQQFKHVGGGDFTQPLMNDNLGGLLFNGAPLPGFGNRLTLSVVNGAPSPTPISGTPTTEITNTLMGPYNNMGVPGAKSYHLMFEGYGNAAGISVGAANPYFARFRSSENATILGDAVAQNPTFFSLWIGNNDVLGYAAAGGAGVNQQGNLDPSTYGSNDITDVNVFANVFNQEVEALSASASGGVILNIPNVTSTPYFNTVPVNAIPLDAQTAAVLNSQFAAYNTQVLPGLVQAGVISAEEAALREVNFQAGQNYVTLVDEDLTDISQILQAPPFSLDAQTAMMLGQIRQANDSDLIPLPSSSFLGTLVNDNPSLVNGVSVPLGDQHVLTAAEQEEVATATAAFNQIIEGIAAQHGLAFVDANALLDRVATSGISFDGGAITSEFATGGAFSLDGIHLTPRGYALIANEIIKSINTTYNATVPNVNIGDYSGDPSLGE